MKKIFLLASFVLNLNAIAQVPSYVPTSGLKAWWSFSGNANDGSGNSLNGVVTNAILSTDRFGNVNQCYDFNYSGARIEVPWNSLLFPDTITVSGWFNIPTGSSGGIFYRSGNGSIDSWKGFILQNDISTIDSLPLYYKDMGGGGYRVYNFLETLYAHKDVWNFFTVVRTPSSLQLYLNGQAAGTLTGLLPYDKPTSTPFIIGNNHLPNDSHVQGKMDDIGIWNRALTQQEITALYNSQITPLNVPSYVPTSGLQGWWPFTENANDQSGNGNNGTVYGSTLTTDRNGISNRAYNFDGGSNYIGVTDIDLKDTATIAAWVYPVGTVGAIVDKDLDASSHAGYVMIYNNSTYGLYGHVGWSGNSNNNILPTNNFLTLNQWHHCVLTLNNGTAKIYVDGILAYTQTGVNSTTQNNDIVLFGKSVWGGNLFSGKLDDIGIWNRTLSQTEITALYNSCVNSSATVTSGATTICGSGSILLTANANTSYQWKKNNVVIVGATNQTYAANATGNYTVTVTNACNTTSTSNAIQINKYALPTCTITANGATSFCTGGSVTLSATTNAGAGALYQWYKGATVISGATNSSYIATTASTYKCKVTKPSTGCSKTSAGIVVTLHDPTASITASGPLTFCAGGSVLFTAVTNAGAGALYQWYKNSTGLSGATNSTYTATVAGNYVVVVTNSYGCTKASAVKKVIINCRLEDSEISSSTFYVSPNPCSTCFVNGILDEQDLMVTDIVGRKINTSFTKSASGFYINLPSDCKGIILIRNIKTGEVVKFVKE